MQYTVMETCEDIRKAVTSPAAVCLELLLLKEQFYVLLPTLGLYNIKCLAMSQTQKSEGICLDGWEIDDECGLKAIKLQKNWNTLIYCGLVIFNKL